MANQLWDRVLQEDEVRLIFFPFYDYHLSLISYFQLLSISICPQTRTASPHQ
jgi:hypothetical protein